MTDRPAVAGSVQASGRRGGSAVDAALVDAAARACGRPMAAGFVVRRGRSTLVRFGGVLARVRPSSDRAHASRELLVASTLEAADVPAIRSVEGASGPIDIDGWAITLWRWIDGADGVAQPAEVGRLAAQLHAATRLTEPAASVPSPIPAFDPLGAIDELLVADAGADAAWLTARTQALAERWSAVAGVDPLGASLVHGDLHTDNVLLTAGGPVLVDLELAGVGPPAYDAAPAAIAVQRYGADAASLDAFLSGWPADPRRWSGFPLCCQIYEAWVTAWAVSQRRESGAAVEEAANRMAALRGEPSGVWTLR